jgi:hypothetical protein
VDQVKVQLTLSEVERYKTPVKGQGGFQMLLRRIAKNIDDDGVLEVSETDLEKLIRYSFEYGQGGFQERSKPTARRLR